ncbi:hypothetical protein BLA9940_00030 [Burkholderia aenigmatica]|nr:hypothetical protein BLA9940_00030 [Burkholderia aenigmatica]
MNKWRFHELSATVLTQGMRDEHKAGGGQDKRVTNEPEAP